MSHPGVPKGLRKGIPKHLGPNILPNFPLFVRLLCYAARKGNHTAIRDVVGDETYEATFSQLVSDAIRLRNALLAQLSPDIRHQLLRGDEIFINLLAPGGYEFACGLLAIAAAGGVVVPMSPAVPVEEASYFARKTRAVGVLVSSSHLGLGESLAAHMRDKAGAPGYMCLDIGPQVYKPQISADEILISADHELDYHAAGIIIFSSGTTGPPKAVVKTRSFFDKSAQFIAAHYNVTEDDVLLHCLPVHHATGLGINFLPFILIGGTIEFRTGGFDPATMWARWQQGGLTIFSGVPTIYTRMMRHFEQLPHTSQSEHVKAARQFKSLLCGTSALPHPLQEKWTSLLGGKRILVRYGSSEMGMAFGTRSDDTEVPDGSVGKKALGMELKLSNGDEGEVLIRTPQLFHRYLFDEEATAASFNSEGYFMTGDIARREGPWYFIMGRASVDIIKSGGYKISALDIERECLSLDYVGEVMVVGVEDEEFGQRVAAAMTLRPEIRSNLSLNELREDLGPRLARYKMPTLLRIVEDFSRTTSGKIVKKTLRTELFPLAGHPDVQRWESKFRAAKL